MPEALPAKLEFSLTPQDLEVYYRLNEHAPGNKGYTSYLSYAYAPVALGVGILAIAGIGGFTSRQFAGALALSFVSYLIGVLCYRYEVLANYRHMMQQGIHELAALGPRTLAIISDRLDYGSEQAQWSVSLALVDRIEIIDAAVCIWVKGHSPLAVPLRVFPSLEVAKAFCDDLQTRIGPKQQSVAPA